MDKLATSLRYVGPVASAFGYTIEDVAGVLQILYNNGFEASMAGTALRSALADLSNATSPAIDKLAALGVSFDEVNPATNSFADIIGLLSGRVTDAGDIMAVFGDRAGPAMIKLIQGGREEIIKYTEAVTGTNAATVAYARQNDTLAGSIDMLKSASEETAIGFSQIFAPAIRGIVDLLTKAVAFINSMPPSLKVLTVGLGLVVPAVLAISVALKALIPTIIQVGGLMTGLFLPVVAATAAIVALGAGIYAIKKEYDKTQLRQIKNEFGELADQLGVTAEEFRDLVAAQYRIGEVTPQTLKALNDLRISLGLTASELSKLVAQANRWNISAESFILAKTQFGLTTLEAKELDHAMGKMSDKTKNFKNIGYAIQTIASDMSLTVEQVIDFSLANERVSDEYKAQLTILKDQRIEEAQYRKEQSEFMDEHKQNLKDAHKTQKDIVTSVEDEIAERERLKDINKTSAQLNQKAIDDALYLQAQYNAKLITEEEYLTRNVEAQQKMYFSLLDTFNIYEKLDALENPGNYPGVIALHSAWNAAKDALKKYIEEQDKGTADALIWDEIRQRIDDNFNAEQKRRLDALKKELEAQEELEKAREDADEQALEKIVEYNEKLRELTDLNYDAIEAEREKAHELVDGLGAGINRTKQLHDAVDAYFKAVQKSKAVEKFEKIKDSVVAITMSVTDLAGTLASGDIEDIIGEIGDMAGEAAVIAQKAGATELSAVLGVVSAVLQITEAVIDFFDLRGERAEKYAQDVEKLENDLLQQQLENQKLLLDYEYEAQVEQIEKIRDAKIQAIRDTFSEELELLLIQMGVIEATTSQAYQGIYDDILEQAAENGMELTAEQKKQIQDVLDAQMAAEEELAAAEKEYEKASRQYTYDKAVADRDAAIMEAKINKQTALSELSWWDIHVKHYDDEIEKLWDALISEIESTPMPALPSYQTGGIVLPASSSKGTAVSVAENGYPELLMNSGPEGQSFMREFASMLAGMINKSGTSSDRPIVVIFEDAGRRIAESSAAYYNNGIVKVKMK